MIEAGGANLNGGIFSSPLSESWLSALPSSAKPKLIKKFGDWDESVESIAKYFVRASGVTLAAGLQVGRLERVINETA